MADCRKCRFFESLNSVAGKAKINSKYAGIYDELLSYYARTGRKVLGYCWRWHKPVVYYRGKCRGYRPREFKQHKLTEYGVVK